MCGIFKTGRSGLASFAFARAFLLIHTCFRGLLDQLNIEVFESLGAKTVVIGVFSAMEKLALLKGSRYGLERFTMRPVGCKCLK